MTLSPADLVIHPNELVFKNVTFPFEVETIEKCVKDCITYIDLSNVTLVGLERNTRRTFYANPVPVLNLEVSPLMNSRMHEVPSSPFNDTELVCHVNQPDT